jgi:hypothetical protein
VKDGAAYTAASLGKRFYLGMILGPLFLVWGSADLWRAWRRRNTTAGTVQTMPT